VVAVVVEDITEVVAVVLEDITEIVAIAIAIGQLQKWSRWW
jgi:hypothetical protein